MKDYLLLNISNLKDLEKEDSTDTFKRIIVSFAFACFIVSFPWELLKGHSFVDVENYIERFSALDFNIFASLENRGFIAYITTEFLWAFLIQQLSNLGLQLNTVFQLISFFSVLIISYFTIKKSGNYLLPMLLLTNPLFIDFTISQMRNSFALAVIIMGIMTSNKMLKAGLLIGATMIHSSSILFILLIYILNRIRISNKFYNLISLLTIGTCIALALSVGKNYILEMLGDRRAHIDEPKSSILYSLFWIILLFLILWIKKFHVKNIFARFSVVLLIIFSVSIFFETYASRYLAIALPFLVISIMTLTPNNRAVFSTLLFSYQLVLFSYWMQ